MGNPSCEVEIEQDTPEGRQGSRGRGSRPTYESRSCIDLSYYEANYGFSDTYLSSGRYLRTVTVFTYRSPLVHNLTNVVFPHART